ncbi:plasmid mobilization protein [Gillisia sp. CAL575]
MKREYIQIRCSIYEKKLLQKREARAGISPSEYLRCTSFENSNLEQTNIK